MQKNSEEQNFYPIERIDSPPSISPVPPEPWRCRMCNFLFPSENTLCPACRTPRRFHISGREILPIAFMLIFFFLVGGLLILAGVWNDSPVPLPPEIISNQSDLYNLGLIYIFCVPIGYFFLRWYCGISATITGVVCIAISLGGICRIMNINPLNDFVHSWQILSLVVFSLFLIAPLICKTILRQKAKLRRKRSGLDLLYSENY